MWPLSARQPLWQPISSWTWKQFKPWLDKVHFIYLYKLRSLALLVFSGFYQACLETKIGSDFCWWPERTHNSTILLTCFQVEIYDGSLEFNYALCIFFTGKWIRNSKTKEKKKTENIPQAAQAAAPKSNSKSIQVCLKREAFFQLVWNFHPNNWEKIALSIPRWRCIPFSSFSLLETVPLQLLILNVIKKLLLI